MKSPAFCTLALLTGLVATASAENNVPPEGFTPLFNGKDLSGWYGWGTQDPTDLWKMTPEEKAEYKKKSVEGGIKDAKGNDKGDHINAHWKVENGELVNDGKGLYLTTDRDYGDFELMVDYKMLPLGDSGIYLRGIPQVQIWDFTEEAKFKLGADKGSGSLWNNKNEEGKFPLKLMDKPFGQWNAFHIKMIGERVTVKLNGEVVQLAGCRGKLRGQRRCHRLQAGQRRRSPDQGRIRKRHHPRRVQAAKGWQQRHRPSHTD